MVPAWTKRLTVPDSDTPVRSRMAIDRLIARREVHLREKTLYRMLYESAGQSEEILGIAWPGCRMGRPVPCWMSTPPPAVRARAGTCTSSGTRPS
ncbi:hypothetical protein GCM10010404_93030 [Nonomuraea africana]